MRHTRSYRHKPRFLWPQPSCRAQTQGEQLSNPSPLHPQCQNQNQNSAPLNPSPPNHSSANITDQSNSSTCTTVTAQQRSHSVLQKTEPSYQSVVFIDSIKVTYTSQRGPSFLSSITSSEALKFRDRRSRTPPSQAEEKPPPLKFGEIEIIELEADPTGTAKAAIQSEVKPKKRSKKHSTELLKDDLRVVHFHPEQEVVCVLYRSHGIKVHRNLSFDVCCTRKKNNKNWQCVVRDVPGWAEIEGESPRIS